MDFRKFANSETLQKVVFPEGIMVGKTGNFELIG